MAITQTDRILIVDDKEDNLLLMQTLLEAEGYNVDLALSGASALDKIETSPPSLVLLDVMMPGMDGYEVTRRIRENENTALIPIVLLTGYKDQNDTRLSELGANGMISKPVNLDELLEKVKGFCG